MVGAYAYTPAIWPPLVASLFLAAIGLYSWRRRTMSGAPWLCVGSLLGILWMAVIALQLASTGPATLILWRKFEASIRVPAVISTTCFVLDYAFPHRWLTRRNVVLLAAAALAHMFMVFAGEGRLLWQSVTVGAGGFVVLSRTPLGMFVLAAGYSLSLVNIATFAWLFVRSPQHRWPVSLMLFGEIASRGLSLPVDLGQATPAAVSPIITGTLLVWTTYALALFAFRIFDPLPFAHQAVFEQIRVGVVVFDPGWRVVSLNAAAESSVGVRAAASRGKRWHDLAPPEAPLPHESTAVDGTSSEPAEMSWGSGAGAHYYAATLSPLKDFRDEGVGHLLMLRDVTGEHRAQARALEHQRVLAIQSERERMARELHDSLGQVLSYASLQVNAAAQLALDGQGEAAAAQLERLGGVVREAHADLREYILNLHSAASIDKPFFYDARQYLDGYTRSYDIRTLLDVDPTLGEGSFPPEMKLQLLRILQEALSNARKHGRAHQVAVSFTAENGSMRMVIADDGCGFDVEEVTHSGGAHYGLEFMRARAEELGARFKVTSAPNSGTCVALQIPLDAAPPSENGRSS